MILESCPLYVIPRASFESSYETFDRLILAHIVNYHSLVSILRERNFTIVPAVLPHYGYPVISPHDDILRGLQRADDSCHRRRMTCAYRVFSPELKAPAGFRSPFRRARNQSLRHATQRRVLQFARSYLVQHRGSLYSSTVSRGGSSSARAKIHTSRKGETQRRERKKGE